MALAVLGGLSLRAVIAVEAPVAWLAWLAPIPLLVLARQGSSLQQRCLLLFATLLATQSNWSFFSSVMPWAPALLTVFLQALLWHFVLMESARIASRTTSIGALLAYPLLWAAADSLLAAWLPDGNWGSLAYSQSAFLPIQQLASLFGTAGLVFLLALPASAIASAIHALRSPGLPFPRYSLAIAVLLPVLAACWGHLRLERTQSAPVLPVGLASINNAIGIQARPVYIDNIRRHYEALTARLAAGGAKVILLPEKIAVSSAARTPDWHHFFASLAARHQVWLIAGLTTETPNGFSNQAWTYNPSGERVNLYQKRALAPPERSNYLAGQSPAIFSVAGVRAGVAICKDMHFASIGRDYAGVSLVFVPAWDFGRDAWLEARTTTLRGIEGGYSIVRSSREGLLTVTDPFGRILAETSSRSLPGVALLATATPVGPPVSTLYSQTGNLFGWLSVAAALLLSVRARQNRSGGVRSFGPQ